MPNLVLPQAPTLPASPVPDNPVAKGYIQLDAGAPLWARFTNGLCRCYIHLLGVRN